MKRLILSVVAILIAGLWLRRPRAQTPKATRAVVQRWYTGRHTCPTAIPTPTAGLAGPAAARAGSPPATTTQTARTSKCAQPGTAAAKRGPGRSRARVTAPRRRHTCSVPATGSRSTCPSTTARTRRHDGNIAAVWEELGDYATSAGRARRALATARDAGHRFGEAGALAQLGRLDAKAGDLDDALTSLVAAQRIAEQIGYRDGLAEIRADLGSVRSRLARSAVSGHRG